MRKADECLKQRHDPRLAEAESRYSLPCFDGGALESIAAILAQNAVMADAFDLEKLAVHLLPEIAQVGEVADAFCDLEVFGIVTSSCAIASR